MPFWQNVHHFLYNWQPLFGSFVGAFIPIFFWFISKKIQENNLQKHELFLTEKLLVYNLNAVNDANKAITDFLDKQLKDLLANIDSSTAIQQYGVHHAFFPYFTLEPLDQRVYETNTGSVYLDNELLFTCKKSMDLVLSVNDIRRQFSETIDVNRSMVFQKLNPPGIQNQMYKDNLLDVQTVIKDVILNNNFNVYQKILTRTWKIFGLYRKLGTLRWQLTFNSKYRFFLTKKKQRQFDKKLSERIEKYLEKTEKQVKE